MFVRNCKIPYILGPVCVKINVKVERGGPGTPAPLKQHARYYYVKGSRNCITISMEYLSQDIKPRKHRSGRSVSQLPT